MRLRSVYAHTDLAAWASYGPAKLYGLHDDDVLALSASVKHDLSMPKRLAAARGEPRVYLGLVLTATESACSNLRLDRATK
jgi:hypothetical protein